MQEALGVSRVYAFSAHVPTSMVDIPSVGANIYFLHLGFDDCFIIEASSNLLQCLVVLSVFWVTNNSDTRGPRRLLSAKKVLVDCIFDFLDYNVDTVVDVL